MHAQIGPKSTRSDQSINQSIYRTARAPTNLLPFCATIRAREPYSGSFPSLRSTHSRPLPISKPAALTFQLVALRRRLQGSDCRSARNSSARNSTCLSRSWATWPAGREATCRLRLGKTSFLEVDQDCMYPENAFS